MTTRRCHTVETCRPQPLSYTDLDHPMPDQPSAAPTTVDVAHFRRLFALCSETFIYDPLMRLEQAGLRQTMLCLVRMHQQARPFNDRALVRLPGSLQSDSALARMFALPGSLSETDRPLWPALRQWLHHELRRTKPRVLFTHFGPDGCLAAPVASHLGIPVVAHFYGYDLSRLLHQSGPAWVPRYRMLFRQAHALVATSNYLLDRLRQIGAPESKLYLNFPGIDLSRFSYQDPTLRFDGRRVDLIHVGRLTAKKCPLQLIEAFACARERLLPRLDLHLTLVGDGELRRACAARAQQLGVDTVVQLLGQQPPEEIPRLLRQHHLYTQYCRTAPNGDTEGIGLSFLEAAASGLPVITTRHNGIPDAVVHGHTGLLCGEDDADQFVEHLVHLASHPHCWRSFGQAGRRHVLKRFSAETQLQRNLGLVQSACAGRSPNGQPRQGPTRQGSLPAVVNS